MDMGTKTWSVAVVKSKSQFKIVDNYEEYLKPIIGKVEFYIPHKVLGNRVVVYLSKYLFVKMEKPENYAKWVSLEPFIKYFIVELIEFDEEKDIKRYTVLTISDEEMERFKKKMELKINKKSENLIGKKVFIRKGAFAGQYGIVKGMKKDKVRIEVDFMTKVSLWIRNDYLEVL